MKREKIAFYFYSNKNKQRVRKQNFDRFNKIKRKKRV